MMNLCYRFKQDDKGLQDRRNIFFFGGKLHDVSLVKAGIESSARLCVSGVQ